MLASTTTPQAAEKTSTDRYYFDYCATTPIHPSVRQVMFDVIEKDFGNPSSMHWAGSTARIHLDRARQQVADRIGCQADEVYFTSGATEADNLALLGVMHRITPGKAHLITSSIEHHAILHTAQQLEAEGYQVTYLPVDKEGLVSIQSVEDALRPETGMISIMLVNNEVGSIQPVSKIGTLAHQHGILFHTDAVQGLGLLDIDVAASQIDLLSISAHKIYGPKGVGACYVRKGIPISPILYGGPQEAGLRPGTENLPGIVALGQAASLTNQMKDGERDRLKSLRQYFLAGLMDYIPDLQVNGPKENVSPHVLSLSFPRADGEMLLLHLNASGIAVSLGSACTSRTIEPSHVLTAMGLSRESIESTLRISMGFPTSEDEINIALPLIVRAYKKARLD